ncbi:hypothetical protein K2173_012304 [Erythroxylum novogranatense]|uniref:Glycosyltransferase n=1 Tax=Erythroxylum novogranatense TaxID=1862640 RepID=A0AAV8SCG8_9ROSI|nr:hypothetical protein K2173_012304 [Erythroxylum novogranatense]
MAKRKTELIFVPGPGIGHIVSSLGMAERLLDHDDQLSVTVLVMKLPITPFSDTYAKSLTASQPRIKLVSVPQPKFPPLDLLKKCPEYYISTSTDNHIPQIKTILQDILSTSISNSVQVAGLVLDFFCVTLVDVAKELGLNSYIFLTSSAGFLSLMRYISIRDEQDDSGFSKSDPDMLIPGFFNHIPNWVLPAGLLEKELGYPTYVKLATRFKEANGIMVNTFAELEPRLIESFLGNQTPPVYPVGPVINLKGQPNPSLDQAQWDKTMKWLDEQPESSVVFLCFGSNVGFGAEQVKEIAIGLEQSGHRFLWSMRVPPDSLCTSPEEMLPKGFLEKVDGRGMICGWSNQVEVLAHKAIGGFVSHCGWNSTLESLWHGVPIATFPIYAEQQLNAFEMVKELGLAEELKLDYGTNCHLVSSVEIERAVRSLIESENDERKKLKEIKQVARKSVMEGGSSFIATIQFIKDVMTENM